MKVKEAQSCLTLCDPMDFTFHGILQVRILEWVAFPFSRGSSHPRDQTQVSRIAGKSLYKDNKDQNKQKEGSKLEKAQVYWKGEPIPSPVDLPDPGIEPGSPALQADALPTELSGKPFHSPGDIPNPEIKPRSPALQADSSPAEPQGKPKNTGVGSLSLLQRI